MFKDLHDYRGQGDRPVVIQSSDGGFLGNWNDGGGWRRNARNALL